MAKITKVEQSVPSIKTKKKVAAYARVSMESERMNHSLSAQISYYSALIQQNPDWQYAGVFADNGISGTSIAKRDEFKRMIAAAKNGDIDIILTKSIQRFARNTVDLLETVRRLRDIGVEVRFEKEHINSMNGDGELMLTILASFAQEESRSISENVKWGTRKRFEQGIKTPGGKDVWNQQIVRRMLSNEKYKGDALLQKEFTVDFLQKKLKKNEGEVPQYYVEGNHEAIISPAVFDLVQEELAKRSKGKTRYSGATVFSNKIKCADCGSWYGSKVWHSTDSYRKTVYRCNNKYNDQKCETPYVTEKDVKAAFVSAYNQLVTEKKEIIANAELVRTTLCATDDLQAEKQRLEDEISMIVSMTQNIVAENARIAQDQDDYQKRYDSLVKRYDETKAQYDAVSESIAAKEAKNVRLSEFISLMRSQKGVISEFDIGLWSSTVDFVTVGRDKDITVTFRDGTEIKA